MSVTLRDELRQRRPFQSPEEEAHLNVVRTAAVLAELLDGVIRPAGLSQPQYNVLRILRGAHPDGLCRNELRDRMLTRMPDVTRLLDRMEEGGLVVRERGDEDRRLVRTRITERGRALVDALDAPVADAQRRQLGHLAPDELRTLSDLLTRARRPA